MTQTDKQTSGNPPAKAGGEPSSQGSEFDRLLDEFDKRQSKPTTPVIPDEFQPVIDYAKGKMTEEATKAFDEDVKETLKFMREEAALKPFKDKMLHGTLVLYAQQNKEFDEAFKNRRKAPAAWKEQLAAARTHLADELVDKDEGSDVRSDIEAATAAVRNAHSAPGRDRGDSSSPAERVGWSDSRWEEHKKRRIAAGA